MDSGRVERLNREQVVIEASRAIDQYIAWCARMTEKKSDLDALRATLKAAMKERREAFPEPPELVEGETQMQHRARTKEWTAECNAVRARFKPIIDRAKRAVDRFQAQDPQPVTADEIIETYARGDIHIWVEICDEVTRERRVQRAETLHNGEGGE
jgi:hypothetical protein